MIIIRITLLLAGVLLVFATVLSAIKTFVLPRSAADPITRTLFRLVRRLFDFRLHWAQDYLEKDRVMALYAPTALLLLVPFWLILVATGFTAIYWATGMGDPVESFDLSGSSLLTLGFARGPTLLHDLLAFTEAVIGLILVALLISYLPTMYSAFSRREVAVTQLAVRAGTPPSSVEFILRAHRIGALHNLRDFWAQWETWFAEVEESHTSLAALVFFRSPDPRHSWVTAAGAVMDAAALLSAVVDVERQPQAELCIRAGYLALQRIAQFFNIKFHTNPHYPAQDISITRREFAAVYAQLIAQGVPVKSDQEQAWHDFAGWRVNYDEVLLALCTLTMTPEAPWSTDRAPLYKPLPLWRWNR